MTDQQKVSIARRDTVKIVLNSPNIAKLMAHDDMHKILEAKGKRVATALRKNFKNVEVRKAFGNDGRASIKLSLIHI